MRIAFLDLDHTLLTSDSNQLWIDYLQSHNLVSKADAAVHEKFLDDYAAGTLDFTALQLFRQQIDSAIHPDVLRKHQSDFSETVLLPAIAPDAPRLIAHLKQEGLLTIIVSATRKSLVDPVARKLGIDHVIASDSRSGIKWPCFSVGKVHHVEDWLETVGFSLSNLTDSWFYSDSHNDVPLLEAVAYPVAVDPDSTLAQIASERGWPVISLRGAFAITGEF